MDFKDETALLLAEGPVFIEDASRESLSIVGGQGGHEALQRLGSKRV